MVTDSGGMSIDPEGLREQIVTAREQLKDLVQKPGVAKQSKAVAHVQVAQVTRSAAEAIADALDCSEVVSWHRLPSGAAVRYVCLQSTSTVDTQSQRSVCSQEP